MKDTQQVWDELSQTLRSFIRRRVSDDHVADDLLQDVFVKVHNKLGSIDDEQRLDAWVFRIARNVVTDYYRRHRDNHLGDQEVESSPDESDQNLNDQVGGWLADRIDELPEDYREAVRLAELKEMRQTEIAERTGLSLSGAKSRVQRGRRMLKDLLLECCHFEFDRRGNVIDYERNQDYCKCCESANECR